MNSEAAVIIGLIVSALAAGIQQVSGPGIIVSGNTGQTILNVLTIFLPLIAGVFTRYQVYSKNSVAAITSTPVDALPPPP